MMKAINQLITIIKLILQTDNKKIKLMIVQKILAINFRVIPQRLKPIQQ